MAAAATGGGGGGSGSGKSKKRVNNTATSRLKQDYMRIARDPVPYVKAEPLPSNILEWHYVVQGPEATPYEGGFYHGKLVFPSEFPFKPPSIYMITPNGRFKTHTRLCLSISDFHPDTWNPAWSVSTILTGLLSFMCEKNPTLGSIETPDFEKQQLAIRSWEFNLANKTFCELFPEIAEEIKSKSEKYKAEQASPGSGANGEEAAPLSGRGDAPLGGAAITNFLVIFGFALFAYAVRVVLKSLNA